MISLMENYDLLGYYKDIVEAGKQLLTLDELINVQLPKLYAHLVRNGSLSNITYNFLG